MFKCKRCGRKWRIRNLLDSEMVCIECLVGEDKSGKESDED